MSFDWSTFILEIVNFLVLVWLLRHFLYRPVLTMIEQRRRTVQKTLEDAQHARDEANALQADYQVRNTQWQAELAQRRQHLGNELEAERQHRLQALQADLAAERTRQETLHKHEQEMYEKAVQARAAAQAAQFASRLLHELATPTLQQRILDLALKELATLTPERIAALRKAMGSAEDVVVRSSFPFAPEERTRIDAALSAIATPRAVHYVDDAALVCGLRISIGAWELDASLAGELRGFAEADGHG